MMNKISFAVGMILLMACCTNISNDQANTNKDSSAVNSLQAEMINSLADTSSAEPYLFTDKNGVAYLSWIEKKTDGHLFKYSTFKGGQWSPPQQISKGDNWFVNWADYPVIATDGKNNMIAHYLEKSEKGTYTYDVKLVTSADHGKTWSAPKMLHDDGKKAEHGFVSIATYGKNYFISWLDGRNTASESGEAHHEGHGGEMNLRGAIVDSTGKKLSEWELDNRVCDCCQTNVAITGNGPVVVYRDRSPDEIRDISIVRWVDEKWTAPQPVFANQWKIDGCPVNGPRIAAIGNHLAVAWFSSPEKSDQVNVVFSSDGGASFTSPIRVDEGKGIGRVDLEMLDSSTAIVSWMEAGQIKASVVHKDGHKDPSIVIANSSVARSSGFPQLTKSGNSILFAWTDEKEKTIKVATISR